MKNNDIRETAQIITDTDRDRAKAADKRFRKKLIIAAAVILAGLGVYFIFFHSTPERTIDRYRKAIMNGDVNEIVSYTFETSFDRTRSADSYRGGYAYSDDAVSARLRDYKSRKGTLKVSIGEITDVPKDEVDALKESLDEKYKTDDITEVKRAELIFTDANTSSEELKDIAVIKVGWKWYVYTGDMTG